MMHESPVVSLPVPLGDCPILQLSICFIVVTLEQPKIFFTTSNESYSKRGLILSSSEHSFD